MAEAENIVKKVCKTINTSVLELKNNIKEAREDEIFMLDIAIKELIELRGVIDFASHKQYTPNDWNSIAKGIV